MKSITSTNVVRALLHLTMVAGICGVSFAQDSVIHNNSLWHDAAGHEIWCNGGQILQEDGHFYWVGYDTGPGRPWKINLYISDDLARWQFRRTLIRQEGEFAQMGWAGRPGLIHNQGTNRYVIIFEADSPRQWPRHKIGFAVSDRVDGDYRLAHVQWAEDNRSTGDQSVFQEGDKAYLLATMDKDIDGRKYMNQSLAIFELSADYLSVDHKIFEGFDNVSGNKSVVPREHSSREASHILKVGPTYYWFSSALVGWNSGATHYATATNLAGPWSKLRLLRTDPPSQDSYNTQHDFVLPVAGSDGTVYVYAGDRYSQWTHRGTGRNIFLPLTFEQGEPVLHWQTTWSLNPVTGQRQAAE